MYAAALAGLNARAMGSSGFVGPGTAVSPRTEHTVASTSTNDVSVRMDEIPADAHWTGR
jgi:hypothetical protein